MSRVPESATPSAPLRSGSIRPSTSRRNACPGDELPLPARRNRMEEKLEVMPCVP